MFAYPPAIFWSKTQSNFCLSYLNWLSLLVERTCRLTLKLLVYHNLLFLSDISCLLSRIVPCTWYIAFSSSLFTVADSSILVEAPGCSHWKIPSTWYVLCLSLKTQSPSKLDDFLCKAPGVVLLIVVARNWQMLLNKKGLIIVAHPDGNFLVRERHYNHIFW